MCSRRRWFHAKIGNLAIVVVIYIRWVIVNTIHARVEAAFDAARSLIWKVRRVGHIRFVVVKRGFNIHQIARSIHIGQSLLRWSELLLLLRKSNFGLVTSSHIHVIIVVIIVVHLISRRWIVDRIRASFSVGKRTINLRLCSHKRLWWPGKVNIQLWTGTFAEQRRRRTIAHQSGGNHGIRMLIRTQFTHGTVALFVVVLAPLWLRLGGALLVSLITRRRSGARTRAPIYRRQRRRRRTRGRAPFTTVRVAVRPVATATPRPTSTWSSRARVSTRVRPRRAVRSTRRRRQVDLLVVAR